MPKPIRSLFNVGLVVFGRIETDNSKGGKIMKKMVLAALLSVSAIGQVSAEVLTEASATVYLSDISDSYPVRLDKTRVRHTLLPKRQYDCNI